MALGVVFGTRPEAIKLAPLIRSLRENSSLECVVINAGQHGSMLDDTLGALGIIPDVRTSILTPGQELTGLMASALGAADNVLREQNISQLVVHGDTTTAASFSIAAFTLNVKVNHVEAGLRTHNLRSPFPEEFNRQLIARVASTNFSPTPIARDNLLREGISSDSILVTGNTAVDSMVWAFGELASGGNFAVAAEAEIERLHLGEFRESRQPFALITLHRRENAGQNFLAVLEAIREVARVRPSYRFLFPVHPNPIIGGPAREIFRDSPNVVLTEPINFAGFVLLLRDCTFVVSDSGGIQEEAVTLGKKILLARKDTERPEGVTSGLVSMPSLTFDTFREALLQQVESTSGKPSQVNLTANPFGDGLATVRIKNRLLNLEDQFEFKYG